jgi:hypothetical protein
MSLTLADVHRIVTDVAHRHTIPIEVVAASLCRSSESAYSEVLIRLPRADAEPDRLLIGVCCATSEPECQRAFEDRLRERLTFASRSDISDGYGYRG